MKKKKGRKKRQGLGQYRIPTAKGTTWFKDKSKYKTQMWGAILVIVVCLVGLGYLTPVIIRLIKDAFG
jgi:hypothetical protein